MTAWPSPNNDPTPSSVIGNVGGISNVWQACDATLTRPNNTSAYAANGLIGSSSAALFKFSNFFRAKGATGLLTGLRLVASVSGIATTNMGSITAHLFNASPAGAIAAAGGSGSFVDQGTFDVMFADDPSKLGTVSFSGWSTGGGSSDTIESYGTPALTPLPIAAAAQDNSLFLVLVAAGAFTPVANQIIKPYAAAAFD